MRISSILMQVPNCTACPMDSIKRRVAFTGSLLLCALMVTPVVAQYGYHFGRNKIQYENFDWKVMQTEHFDIYYYPEMEELAEHGAYFAEESYDELKNKFAYALNHRVPIIFYSSNLHFKQTNITPGFIPDGVGGFFEFLKGRVVIPANGNLHRFRRVIRHELVHVFTYNKVLRVMRDHRKPPENFLPLWFTEGIAEYWSGEPDHSHEMIMRDALFSNNYVPLQNIFRINGTFQMYKQGEAICRFIAETYGEEKLLMLIDNFWKDRDFRRVMELTLKEDFKTISDKIDVWLKEQYYPKLENIQVPSLLSNPLAVRGFNAKPVPYTFADGTTNIYYVGNQLGYSNLYTVPVDSLMRPTGNPEVIIRGERSDRFESFHLFESRMSISPQGKLAFVTKSGERDVVHTFDLEADELEATYSFEDLIAVYSPDWSPDGKQLVFTSIDRSGFSDLFVYNTETQALRRLTQDAYDDRDPAWRPDGKSIAFSSDRTGYGETGYFNIFTFSLESGAVQYVTNGPHLDQSPRWHPDGDRLVFTRAARGESGKFSAQNIWVVDMTQKMGDLPTVASTQRTGPTIPITARNVRQLTELSSAAFDPVWTEDGRLVFTSFESFRFTIRSLNNADSLYAWPRYDGMEDLSATRESWAFKRLEGEQEADLVPYRRKYRLDIAQGGVSQNAVLGTTGGAVMAFSDMLGDDYLFLTVFNTGDTRGDLLKSLSFQVARTQLHRRTNYTYGLYRFSGRRYDIRDPDAATGFPFFYETIYGGFGAVSYPISKFRRVEFGTSLNWSDKDVPGVREREALLLSNSVALVHDNALYSINGPVDGWRANLTAAYTTDVRFSNVSYVSLIGDVRHYFRIGRQVTFASWAMGRINHGREARLNVIGGSWDLRGYRFLSVRGQKLWHTSHELRFPILTAPSLYIPILAPFGIANVRGALFFDAAHAWNDDYNDVRPEINAGETLGATGIGFRMNLFGGFVLRYDIGYRYRDGFRERDKTFRQFFFGWDF